MHYLYLDESGDLGDLLQSPGTSQYFVIAILEVCGESNRKAIEKAAVRTLRNKLHGKRHRQKAPMTELKAAKTVFAIKEYFYRQIAGVPFKLYTVILDKARFVNQPQMNKKRIYQFITHYHDYSHENKPLQAIDLFAWGIYQKYEAGDTQWYEIFREKIAYELLYPPKIKESDP